MTRLRKRSRKFAGTRSHGTGNAKNRRGKGCKGGWGRAGMHKHRYTYIVVHEPDFFGVHGFASVRKKKVKTVSLFQIEQLAAAGKLEKRDGKDCFEFEGKVLGTGRITKAVTVRASAFSEGAAEKIKAAGGQAEKIEPAKA